MWKISDRLAIANEQDAAAIFRPYEAVDVWRCLLCVANDEAVRMFNWPNLVPIGL